MFESPQVPMSKGPKVSDAQVPKSRSAKVSMSKALSKRGSERPQVQQDKSLKVENEEAEKCKVLKSQKFSKSNKLFKSQSPKAQQLKKDANTN